MTTPVLTAALNRKPRRNPRAVQRHGGEGGYKKSPHNFVAEAGKKKAGAPLGNRNAARDRGADVERHARLDALLQQTYALADAADQAWRERARLAALLAEPQP